MSWRVSFLLFFPLPSDREALDADYVGYADSEMFWGYFRRNEQDGEMGLLTDLFNLVLRSSVAEGQYAL